MQIFQKSAFEEPSAAARARCCLRCSLLPFLLAILLWPSQAPLAQERRWTAMETEVRGIVFRIPRAH
ncbi:MAG: hypothetical protein ACKOC9_05965, partial [Alphaproteobacteria bacterium]